MHIYKYSDEEFNDNYKRGKKRRSFKIKLLMMIKL